MKTGEDFSNCALLDKWNKYKYTQLDCQGFVEEVLKDIGITKSDGSFYNWKGSNSMYRNFYQWRGTKEECIEKFGCVPLGAFVYIWRETGADLVGYFDDLGNFTHVGIYCGNNIVRDSTRSTKTGRDGVGNTTLDRFTHVSLFAGLDYSEKKKYNSDVMEINDLISEMESKMKEWGKRLNEIAGCTKST